MLCSKNSAETSFPRAQTTLISTNGEHFPCENGKISPVVRELLKIGQVDPKSMIRNIHVPFSTNTLKALLDKKTMQFSELEEADWFELENTMEDINKYVEAWPEIAKLHEKIANIWLESISDSNCFLLLKKFREYGCKAQAEKAMRYIKHDLIRMVFNKTVDVEFYRIDVADFEELLNSDDLNVDRNEDLLIQIIDYWIAASAGYRQNLKDRLMSTIRLKALDSGSASILESKYEMSTKPPRDIQDVVMIVGGWFNKRASNSIEWYDVENCTWHRSNIKLPCPLAYHGAAIIDENLYVFGGSDGNRYKNETWKLSSLTSEWTRCDQMFECRNYITNSSVVFDDKIYVFGGLDGREYDRALNNNPASRSHTGEFYDPKKDKWTKTANMTRMRSDCAAAVFNDIIIITGGFNGSDILNSVEIYNPRSDTFVEVQNLPIPITGHTMVFHESNLYIVGGFDGTKRLDQIWVRLESGNWQECEEKLKVGRSTSTCCSYRGAVILAGGYTDACDNTCEVLLSSSPFFVSRLISKLSALKILMAPNWRQPLTSWGSAQIDNLAEVSPRPKSCNRMQH